jgi:hypothetical protein
MVLARSKKEMTKFFGVHKHLSSNCEYNSQLCHVDVTHRVANYVTWGVNWQIDHGSLCACRIVFFKPIKTYHFKKEGPQETTH